jgi:glycosidase
MREYSVNSLPEAGSRGGLRRDPRGADPGHGLTSPEWARGALLYCVYPRAFSPEGTFDGIRRRLPEIRDLGAAAIWLLPIHPVGLRGRKGAAGSPYAIRDYRAIDPALGTPAQFRALVEEAHHLGLRVLLDLVLNHAALDHPFGVAGGFHRDARGRPTRRVRDWSDVADWNFGARGVREELLGAIAQWVGEFGVDGFRCDVAGMVPHDFWSAARERLAPLRPDHFLLAEWDDPELHRVAFHATYDWELYRALVAAFHGRIPAGRLSGIVEGRATGFPSEAQPLRFVENHDEPRVRRRFGSAAAAVTAFTAFAGGLFLLYNGQEIGAVHRPDLFGRDPIRWDRSGAEDARRGMAALLAVRSAFADLSAPVAIPLPGDSRLAAYARSAGDHEVIVALNLSGHFTRMPEVLLARTRNGALVWPAGGPGGPENLIPPRSTVAWSRG